MLELIGGLVVTLIFLEFAFRALLGYFDWDSIRKSRKQDEEFREKRRKEIFKENLEYLQDQLKKKGLKETTLREWKE